MSIREEQCNKVCRILDDVLANRTAERDSLIVAVRKAFESLEQFGNSEPLPSAQPECAKDFVMLKVIDLNGRPYYSIIYLENGNEFEGYSSYNLKVISEYLKMHFGFAQPEKRTDKRTEKHACDLIDRQPSSSCVRENDTISRAAALKALSRGSGCGTSCYRAIKVLPSAQPEIIRCKDCKWYGRADKRRFYRGTDCLNHRIDTIVPDKDYCSRAERRTDD